MDWVRKVLHRSGSSPSTEKSAQVQSDLIVPITVRRFPEKYGTEKSCIGQGISSKVYLYENIKNNNFYAVKSYEKLNLKDTDEIKSIEKEIKIHNLLNHDRKHVVQLIDSVSVKRGNKFFLVLEYMPYSLNTLVMTYGILIPQVDRLCYFKQITIALNFLQSQNIGHRDLKLENCCVDHDGNLKLIDFGSSTIGDIGYGMAGSPPYAAPEIHSQLKYNSFNCDMWSLGILLINLFYLSKQSWKSARHDDPSYKRYTEEPTIFNAVRVLGNISNDDPIKAGVDALIISLLDINVISRITMVDIFQNSTFKQMKCCVEETTSSHKHKLFN